MPDVREHYATDLPRGGRIVGGGWDGMTVKNVRALEGRRPPTVELTLGSARGMGCVVECPAGDRLRVDHDTDDRRARVELALALGRKVA